MKPNRYSIIKLPFFLITLFIFTACSTPSPQKLNPPNIKNPYMAQITVKREFRLVGGGTPYVHDIYDTGTRIDYNADVPGPDDEHMLHFSLMHEITPELFDEIKFFWAMGQAPAPLELPKFSDPLKDHERLVERVDKSLFGRTLIKSADLNRGGVTANPDLISMQWGLLKKRGKLERVKLRQLYDNRNKVLYRVLEQTNEKCFGPHLISDYKEIDLTGFHEKIAPSVHNLAPDFTTRSAEFTYGEICGLIASFDMNWNARRIASLRKFEPMTWERPPGEMNLYALLGGMRLYANEIDVEAGNRYVGIYDPYFKTFIVEPFEY